MSSNAHPVYRRERGAALIEFSLSVILFIVLVMGVIEFSRAMFLINMAGRATQMATRLVTVCGYDNSQFVRDKVRSYIEASGQVKVSGENWLVIKPDPTSCYFGQQSGNVDPCWVTTWLSGMSFNLMIPLIDINIAIPEYKVTQVREAMSSLNNPACR